MSARACWQNICQSTFRDSPPSSSRTCPRRRASSPPTTVYTQAPRDGTVIGTFSRNFPISALLGGHGIEADPRRFLWLGATSFPGRICAVAHNADQNATRPAHARSDRGRHRRRLLARDPAKTSAGKFHGCPPEQFARRVAAPCRWRERVPPGDLNHRRSARRRQPSRSAQSCHFSAESNTDTMSPHRCGPALGPAWSNHRGGKPTGKPREIEFLRSTMSPKVPALRAKTHTDWVFSVHTRGAGETLA
jgi:hypothetical protein